MRRFIMVLTAAAVLLLSAGCGGAESSDLSESTSAELPEEISQTDSSGVPESVKADTDFEEFKGLPETEDTISTVNSKWFFPSLLCCGDGNTFFMWNGTVYKHDGKTTEALFEKSAYDLNYSDGRLYFIENDSYDVLGDDILGVEGLLYYYDLETKELKAVTDYPIRRPIADNGNIYYIHYATADNPEPPTGICRVDENGVSEWLYRSLSYIRYGNYRLTSDGEKRFFSDGDRKLLLENIDLNTDCVDGGYYYFRPQSDKSLNRLSLLTGDIMTLKFDEEDLFCFDYTVLNDKIYFVAERGALMTYNEDTGDYTKIKCEYDYGSIDNEEADEHIIVKDECAFRYIYSDGKNIYGVGGMVNSKDESADRTYYFMKLTINGDSAECEILA